MPRGSKISVGGPARGTCNYEVASLIIFANYRANSDCKQPCAASDSQKSGKGDTDNMKGYLKKCLVLEVRSSLGEAVLPCGVVLTGRLLHHSTVVRGHLPQPELAGWVGFCSHAKVIKHGHLIHSWRTYFIRSFFRSFVRSLVSSFVCSLVRS